MPAPESPPTTGFAPLAKNRADHRFSFRGWQVTVQLSGVLPDGCVEGHLDLRADDYSCRLMLAQPRHDYAVYGKRSADAAHRYNDPYVSLQRGFVGTDTAPGLPPGW